VAGGAARSLDPGPGYPKILEAENDYTESLLGHTGALQKKLVAEMRGRIKEDDSSVPAPDWSLCLFAQVFAKAASTNCSAARPRAGGEAEIILYGDKLAADHKYSSFGGARHSPDHKLQAWERGRKRFGYFSIACGTDRWRGPRRRRRGNRRRGGVERGRHGASSTSSSTTITARCRSGAIASARRRRTMFWSMKRRIPAGSPIS